MFASQFSEFNDQEFFSKSLEIDETSTTFLLLKNEFGFGNDHIKEAYRAVQSENLEVLIAWMVNNSASKKQEIESQKPKPSGLVGKKQVNNEASGSFMRKPSFSSLKRSIQSKVMVQPSGEKGNESSLPLIRARLELMAIIDLVKVFEYQQRLLALSKMLTQIKNSPNDYAILLEELLNPNPLPTIQNFREKVTGAFVSIFRYHNISNGSDGAVDMPLFTETVLGFNELNLFTEDYKNQISRKYITYCKEQNVNPDQEFLAKFLLKEAQQSRPDLTKQKNVVFVKSNVGLDRHIKSSPNFSNRYVSNSSLEERKLNDNQDLGILEEDRKVSKQEKDPNLTDREACVICMWKLRGTLLMPCKHFILCVDCANPCKECPLCKSAIKNKINVFWA